MARLHPMLEPYSPTSDDPWDRTKAHHLLARTGFGPTPVEVDQAVADGPAKTVARLLDFPDAGVDETTRTDVPDLSSIEGVPASFAELREQMRGKTQEERQRLRQMLQRANREAVGKIGEWWIARMADGPYPLQEKLTLFWHGHFTTSARDERSASLIWQQNELLRRQSAGSFETFVRRISRDPAMLDYLNNSQNRKAHPNENYARELMELFTLGIGNYTENDIKEAARAFTGWAHDGDDFIFRSYDHDTGEKTFMGRRGNWDGDDIISIILRHPRCSPYIAGRLWRFFVSEELPEAVEEGLGEVLRDNDYQLRPLLMTLLRSKAFYQPDHIGSQIKSPVQLVVGTMRKLEMQQLPPPRQITNALNQMGQIPLMPPNVKGWPGGRAWINTATLFARYNTGLWLVGAAGPALAMDPRLGRRVGLRGRDRTPQAAPVNQAIVQAQALPPTQTVNAWIDRMLGRPIASEKRDVLLEGYVNAGQGEAGARKLAELIVSMPEYQLT